MLATGARGLRRSERQTASQRPVSRLSVALSWTRCTRIVPAPHVAACGRSPNACHLVCAT